MAPKYSRFPFLLLSALLALSFCKPSSSSGIVVYWGTHTDEKEGTLAEACFTGLYSIVNIGFLNVFGGGQTPSLGLSKHCSEYPCTSLIPQIKQCQEIGVKVFISIGGAPEYSNYTLTSSEDAKSVADYIWNNFLGGESENRTFGDAILDGVDLDIRGFTTEHWDELVRYLHEYNNIAEKRFHLSAAAQCAYPDPYLNKAIQTGLFDYVWVGFYNDPSCEYNNVNGDDVLLKQAWHRWWTALLIVGNTNTKLFLGLPATLEAAPGGGYIPVDVLERECQYFKLFKPQYGGVSLWDRHHDRSSGYSSQIKSSCEPEDAFSAEKLISYVF
ncbi:hypothetical protein Tsubulata_045826 [Turnera subulata]|uniref:GH18 domain-containing protein n=1 Tax=Turnera subulata TaxID=218843 RepID=A0A9Q0FZZ9_9ROSI|nr:hypothetical protein Tsubulata_045826 [Turnera subulata]